MCVWRAESSEQINGMVFSVFPFPLHIEFSIIVFYLVVLSLRVSVRVILSYLLCDIYIFFVRSFIHHYHTYMRTPFPISQSRLYSLKKKERNSISSNNNKNIACSHTQFCSRDAIHSSWRTRCARDETFFASKNIFIFDLKE